MDAHLEKMKNMSNRTKDRLQGAALAALVMLCVAATVTTKYRGTFIGDGAQLTSISSANLTGTIVPARLPVGLSTSNYVGTFSGDGSALTGIVNTNYNETLYAAATNTSIYNSAAVTGLTGDGIRLAVRATNGQTNDVFAVQDNNSIMQFGVKSGGMVIWGNGPTNATAQTATNLICWMIVTNAGKGYAIPLHPIP